MVLLIKKRYLKLFLAHDRIKKSVCFNPGLLDSHYGIITMSEYQNQYKFILLISI